MPTVPVGNGTQEDSPWAERSWHAGRPTHRRFWSCLDFGLECADNALPFYAGIVPGEGRPGLITQEPRRPRDEDDNGRPTPSTVAVKDGCHQLR